MATSTFDEGISIITDPQKSFTVAEESREAEETEKCILIRVSIQKILLPISETLVYFITSVAGLVGITSHLRLITTRMAIVAQGIMEVIKGQQVVVMVPNLSKNPIHLLKKMYALGVYVPTRIVEVPTEITGRAPTEEEPTTDIMCAIQHYK